MRATIAIVFLLGLMTCPNTYAQETERVSLFQTVSFDQPQPERTEPDDLGSLARPAARFGAIDTQHWMLGSMFGPDLNGHKDISLHGQYTYFLIDDFEVGVEAGVWAMLQNDDTVGISSSLVMRYHFYQAERWSAFGELGMGMILTGDNAPDDGTSFNLMPRVGAGITYKLFDNSSTRLITGLRWHHISNARIRGEARNPARDAPGLYVGLLFDF
jgi:hypothetical protein